MAFRNCAFLVFAVLAFVQLSGARIILQQPNPAGSGETTGNPTVPLVTPTYAGAGVTGPETGAGQLPMKMPVAVHRGPMQPLKVPSTLEELVLDISPIGGAPMPEGGTTRTITGPIVINITTPTNASMAGAPMPEGGMAAPGNRVRITIGLPAAAPMPEGGMNAKPEAGMHYGEGALVVINTNTLENDGAPVMDVNYVEPTMSTDAGTGTGSRKLL